MKINLLIIFVIISNSINIFAMDSTTLEELFNLAQSDKIQDARKIESILNNSRTNFINSQNKRGDTLLIIAARNGNLNLLLSLLRYKPNLDIQDINGDTALMWSIFEGHDDITESLLIAGANPNIPNQLGDTPLMRALQFNDKLGVVALLMENFDVLAKDKQGNTAIKLAIKFKSHPGILLKLLQKRNFLQNDYLKNKQDLFNELLFAIKNYNLDATKLLVMLLTRLFTFENDYDLLNKSIYAAIANPNKEFINSLLPLLLKAIEYKNPNLFLIDNDIKLQRDQNIIKIIKKDLNVYLGNPEINRNREQLLAVVNVAELEQEQKEKAYNEQQAQAE